MDASAVKNPETHGMTANRATFPQGKVRFRHSVQKVSTYDNVFYDKVA
jgi:hypothetical protein